MTDLTDFLLQRIAEDEAQAREASAGPWSVDDESYVESIYSDGLGMTIISGGRWGGEASIFGDDDDAKHIVRWNPARVLAECEAKRRIIAEVREADLLRLLALPYADHEDFRDEWRPA